ncbi:MAG: ADP-forming succinate--CoA ligase subunit beta [Deltaproteobacteria bacterium CG12_big_fil_rev_8_21_14_0_65_43_10]|nr:MAG: succinate--CoA ligase subunit beta [Deltaproteobacteria bacterium CG2_30_43_15]PIQ46208.1 MAG: ADP-forming succinate--CoA ligase subunit beta [Deltaproteobacteria bacterium CG12_big_fil_rev_8_21_14_0_65_43_10]PIU86292.1 MAG: ADP-forming succinate--CoA ligase subunit beta [Deltaproteobacteria bacterium CG06_land_8_20_14_3_00_44_19]PIX21903.1 MAG: ADP-forming succinate--CoA ligase subunit beta [Deltaproteobacteria bacterium CG_4_8_14_3_um_filter_43_13]PIZ20298.1 MAG: ADP-forming succinate
MKIHEYQAKRIFVEYGIPIPDGDVADTPEEVREITNRIGKKVVIKAQIHAGGRGKGGGVKTADSPQEAEKVAREIIGMNLVTHQTGPEGKRVKRVLVEEALDVEKELYLGIVIDRSRDQEQPVIMASEAGGMEIEEVASKSPEKIIKVGANPVGSFSSFQGRKLAYGLGMDKSIVSKASKIIEMLYRIFMEKDATLIEINPFVLTRGGELLALDAKINFDDDGLYRHPEIKGLRDLEEEEPLEIEASNTGVNYIKLDGNVGCMVNGAGLAMATMDLIKLAGGAPANFLDVGGGATAERIEKAFRILTSDKNVKAILVNIFGGILRCDRVASGVIEAASKMNLNLPMVVRLQGTNVEEGRKLLEGSNLKFEVAEGLFEAAQKVVALL